LSICDFGSFIGFLSYYFSKITDAHIFIDNLISIKQFSFQYFLIYSFAYLPEQQVNRTLYLGDNFCLLFSMSKDSSLNRVSPESICLVFSDRAFVFIWAFSFQPCDYPFSCNPIIAVIRFVSLSRKSFSSSHRIVLYCLMSK